VLRGSSPARALPGSQRSTASTAQPITDGTFGATTERFVFPAASTRTFSSTVHVF
jgi:hypothetical protein